MAHLTIHTETVGKYRAGDVIFGRTRHEIQCCNCEHIANLKSRIPHTKTPVNSLLKTWNDLTYEYRFERVSATEILRVRLADNFTELFGSPAIDVREFVARRGNAAMFGEDGSELWYGGNIRYASKAIEVMWTAIENQTGIHPDTHPVLNRWPCGNLEVKHFLACTIHELESNAAVYRLLTQPKYTLDAEGRPTQTTFRERRIPLVNLATIFNIRVQDIQDKNIEIARRNVLAGIAFVHRDDRCETDVATLTAMVQV